MCEGENGQEDETEVGRDKYIVKFKSLKEPGNALETRHYEPTHSLSESFKCGIWKEAQRFPFQDTGNHEFTSSPVRMAELTAHPSFNLIFAWLKVLNRILRPTYLF